MKFNRDEFDGFLITNKCVGFFDPPRKLKSGRLSPYYINVRNALSTVGLKRDTAKFVYQFAEDQGLRPNVFLGIPEGATPLGIAVNELIDYIDPYRLSAVMLRAKPKDHGDPKDRYSIGQLEASYHVVLIEDVTTTGGSAGENISRIKNAAVVIDKLIACANRLEKRDDGRTVEEFLREDFGVDYASMTDSGTLVPKAYDMLKPSEKIAKAVEEYFKKYGATEISLAK